MITISSFPLQDLLVPDEQQLKKLEALLYNNATPETLTKEICSRTSVKQTLKLLSLKEKKPDHYEKLVFRDALLQVKGIEFGSIKYLGQVRNMKMQSNT